MLGLTYAGLKKERDRLKEKVRNKTATLREAREMLEYQKALTEYRALWVEATGYQADGWTEWKGDNHGD